MKYPKGQPTVRGRASVLHTDVKITFQEKHQLDEIMTYLVEEGLQFSFERIGGDSLTPDVFELEIYEICWANNVTRLFKKLEEFDYNSGRDEE